MEFLHNHAVLRKILIQTVCLMIIVTSFPVIDEGRAEAASSVVPTLNAYETNGHVKLEWAVEMDNADVMTETSFESGQEEPSLYYRGKGNQSFSNDAFTGTRSLQVTNTQDGTGNRWSYPETSSTFSTANFKGRRIKNKTWLSINFKAKGTEGSNGFLQFQNGSPWANQGIPRYDKDGKELKYGETVSFSPLPNEFSVIVEGGGVPNLDDGSLAQIVTSHSKNHEYGVVFYKWVASKKKYVLDTGGGGYIHSTWNPMGESHTVLKDTFIYGEPILHLEWIGVFANQRNIPMDNVWRTYSTNFLLDHPLYDFYEEGFDPTILWSTDGRLNLDDLKFGYATEVEVYRDGKSIYRGYLSDFEDMEAVDKAAPNPVSNVQIKIGHDRKPIITWNPANDNASTYNYTIKGITRNGETPLSAPRTVSISSGIKGYAVAVDTNPNTIPTQVSTTGTNLTAAPQNQNFYVHVATLDYQGNVSNVVHELYEDRTAPQLNVSADHTHPSQGSVTLTATAADYETGLKYIELPDGRKIESGTAQYVATSNGTYTFRAVDNAGNVTEQSIQVWNIDREAPIITITPAERPWDSADILVEIHYTDAQSGIDPNSRMYAITNSPAAPTQWKRATADLQYVTLTDEGQWYLHAKAADRAGNKKQVVTQALQLQHLPKTPELRVTSVEENRVNLEWDLPAGGALTNGYEYEIENLTTGQSWKVAYPGHTLQDQNVDAGKIYEYRIMAKNFAGSSAHGVPVSALTLPAAVKGLSVNPIGREALAASVKFDPAESADQYHIQVTENTSKQLVYESTVTEATYQPIQNLQPGVNYTVKVTPENGSGRGAAASVGYLSLPDAPGQFSAIQINTDGIYLGWTSVTSATYYDLERDQSFIYGGTDLFYKDTGLQSGTEYNYGVAAKNDTGYGMKSELANVITLPARTTVTAAAYGTDRITLQWPSVKGAADYVIGVDGQEVKTVTAATYGTLQTYEITGLNPGVSYRFSLQPENRSGSGEETYVVASTLPEAVAEGRVEITDIGETSMAIQWDKVSGATTYRVRVGDRLYELSDTKLNVNGLLGGTKYEGILEAGNASGYGPGTRISFLTLPPQVGEIVVVEKGSELQLSWKPVPSAKKYVVEQNGQEVAVVSESGWTAKDMAAGETYRFTVRAVNETGEGEQTPSIWRMLPDGMDDLKVRVTDITEHSTKLSWEAAAGADGYRVYEGEKQLLQVTETSAILDGLESAKDYEGYTVIPYNSTGEAAGASVVPKFETMPSGDFKVEVKASQHELKYSFSLDSAREMFVVSKNSKEIYRGNERVYSLTMQPSSAVKVEVWTENRSGQRSKGQIIEARTLDEPSTGGSSSSGTTSKKPDPIIDSKKPDEPSDVSSDKKDEEKGIAQKDIADIEGLWNEDRIRELIKRGIFSLNEKGEFEALRGMTRAEFMAVIVRAAELGGKEAPPMLYKDVKKEAWYYRELQIAHSNGIVNGFNTLEFRPNSVITREQAAKMLGNVMERKKGAKLTFRDKENIANWAMKEIQALAASEIIEGYPDGTFRPKASITRAESADLFYRFLGLSQESQGGQLR